MGKNSAIEWCDHTFNAWRGCRVVNLSGRIHPGCVNCYAARMSLRNPGLLGTWGHRLEGGQRVSAPDSYWKGPVTWNRSCEQRNVRERVFCQSLGDIFEESSSPVVDIRGNELTDEPLNHIRSRLWSMTDDTPYLDWLILTKRPQNVERFYDGKFRHNVWLGVSVSDQRSANSLMYDFLQCRPLFPVLFVSYEPAIEPIDFKKLVYYSYGSAERSINAFTGETIELSYDGGAGVGATGRKIDWLICGGESGPKARAMPIEAARSARDQCNRYGVPFFFKQWGEWLPAGQKDVAGNVWFPEVAGGNNPFKVGKKRAGRNLDGHKWSQFPEVAVTA